MAGKESILNQIHIFESQHAAIPCLTPSSPTFDQVRAIYAHPEIAPLAIIRPQSIEDVSTTLSSLSANRIPFTVRSGGHDMHGRSMRNDAVALDMRLLNSVRIHSIPEEGKEAEKTSSTAMVGGGILTGDLISALQEQGFVTPVPSLPAVGYVGWAMYGGYGAYSARFGLGVDQIAGARVVDARGVVVEADHELLTGIRGAGGAFGVVVELTVRIYRVDRILAGMIMFKSDNLSSVIPEYNRRYRALAASGLPPPLSVQQGVLNAPTPTFTVLFVWSSPGLDEGYKWLAKIKSLGPFIASTVQETTPRGCLEEAERHFAKSTQGSMWTISLRSITDEVANVIAHYTTNMPSDPHILFDMHQLRVCSPCARPKELKSVFSAREPHFAVEINTIVEDGRKLGDALAWGRDFRDALRKTSAENIFPAQYLSFMREEEVDHSKIFGDHLSFLRGLKERLGPGNVFKAAISYL
ncbi:hypothetical protein ASPCAL14026 [Aspergillus calidoustus]|uniref:FAD-binding PCMH-type domain-containing protein n=1 Tax=Aspergillus calidoustus TaxID=454130 RepID=A0A0U5GHM8_ASPCI|nr:hypothetical protein ASPCAL14026 [Aspergillus calidoustus]